MTKRQSAKPRGRPPMTQTARVISAVRRGLQDARSIAKGARVPPKHVHPILSRLRREGRVAGFTGSLRIVEAKGARR